MQNEFEKKVLNTLQGFSIEPAVELWDNIEKAMAEKKRRRLGLLLWFTAAIMLLGGSTYYFLNTGIKGNLPVGQQQRVLADLHKTQKVDETANQPASSNNGSKVLKDGDDNLEPTIEHEKLERLAGEAANEKVAGSNKVKQANEKLKDDILGKNRGFAGSNKNAKAPVNFLKNPAVINGKALVQTSVKPLNRDSVVKGESRQLPSSPKIKTPANVAAINGGNATSNTTIAEVPQATAMIATNDSAQQNLADKSNKFIDSLQAPVALQGKLVSLVATKKKLQFGITLLGGFSDNISGRLLSSNKSLDAQFNSPANNVSGGTTDKTITVDYGTSKSFGIGGFLKVTVTKRLHLAAGLSYQYFSATSLTGAKVSNQRQVFDSLTNRRIEVSNYFTSTVGAGSTPAAVSRFTNKYHLVQLPIDGQWQINGHKARPIYFTAGLTPAYLIATNALYYDAYNNISYKSNQQFKKLQLFAQAGFMFKVFNVAGVGWQFGPYAQYGFTNLSKPVYGNSQHLGFAGLKANLLFK